MNIRFFFFAAAAAMLAACSSDNETASTSDDRVAVEFSASVGATQTRAVDQEWTAGDAIGIYMVKSGNSLLSANISESAANVPYVAAATSTSGSFSPQSATIYYPVDGSAVDFYAYYPQTSAITNDATSGNYLYAVNVASQSSQENIDLLYADKVTGKSKTDRSVALNFKHQLCKVILTVEPGDGVAITDMTALTVKVDGQNTTATFDLTQGALLSNAANAADITLYKQSDAYVYEAILLPDATTSRTFEFDLNNNADAPFKWTMDKALDAGSKYTYTVKMNRTGIEVTGQISAWNEGDTGEVDAN